jgi:hypothetical protein
MKEKIFSEVLKFKKEFSLKFKYSNSLNKKLFGMVKPAISLELQPI